MGTVELQAQFVTIPDPAFVSWLNANGFNSCLNGNLLDTTCSQVINTTSVNCSASNIYDLTGIGYFDNLDTLVCAQNFLTTLTDLPGSLSILHCEVNTINSIGALPDSLKNFGCADNHLTIIPALPATLRELDCSRNQLTVLPALPSGLKYFYCNNNQLNSLPILPDSLIDLRCNYNNLTSLPTLKNSLTILQCSFNSLVAIPPLPPTLKDFYCFNNQLTGLPTLTDSLINLSIRNNLIDTLPALPSALFVLDACNNKLSFITSFSDSLVYLDISDNPDLYCLPPFKHDLLNFFWGNTGVSCFPNVINIFTDIPAITNYNVCDVINLHNCAVDWNIKGQVFTDGNFNCQIDTLEQLNNLIKLNLYNNGVLVNQTFSKQQGQYTFDKDTGSYNYSVDTSGLPFLVNCPVSGSYSSSISLSSLYHDNKNFSIDCKPGFDVGVSTILCDSGIFRPANLSRVTILAGDISNMYGMNCASGVNGSVRVIIQGSASFFGSTPGALIPTVNGDTLTYAISDFGLVNLNSDFRFIVLTDTSAQLGEEVCFAVSVTPIAGDNNPSNNYYNHCFVVVNSYDPNDKQVSPFGLTDTSQYWLTYTVRFQNTGNAPAQHVYILDSLDQYLDETSIQLLTYSHEPFVQVIGKVVKFNFPNINLPDSVNNEPASHGFVQFKVRRFGGLPIGTQIQNTAYIYFDFNPPIQTNTTTNVIALLSSVGMEENLNNVKMTLYPNPVSGGDNLYVDLNGLSLGNGSIGIFDMGGRKVFSQSLNLCSQTNLISLPNLAPGIYLTLVETSTSRIQRKLVVVK